MRGAEVGAEVVVCHSGNVDMPKFSFDLLGMAERGQHFSQEYENLKLKAQITRDRKAPRQIKALIDSLEKLAPVVQETGVHLCLENLPTWEALPTELESEKLMRQFHAAGIRLWWYIGHAQIRDNMGFINASRWLQRLAPYISGCHIHDVAPPGQDHLAPPRGKIDFPALADWARTDIVRVLEPAPNTETAHLAEAIKYLRAAWNLDDLTTEGNK